MDIFQAVINYKFFYYDPAAKSEKNIYVGNYNA